MKEYCVAPVFKFNDEDLVDIISSAVYDIGYWACIDNESNEWYDAKSEVSEDATFEDVMLHILLKGEKIRILDTEGDELEDYWDLTLENLLKGIKLTIEHGFWNGKLDDIDGEIGDMIFQYALFDEIVYG